MGCYDLDEVDRCSEIANNSLDILDNISFFQSSYDVSCCVLGIHNFAIVNII